MAKFTSKAAEKRFKDKLGTITSMLNRSTMDIKEKWLDMFAANGMKEHDDKLARMLQAKEERTFFASFGSEESFLKILEGIQAHNKRRSTRMLNHLAEADEIFTTKINSIAMKITEKDFSTRRLQMEEIRLNAGEFKFLLTNMDGEECDARFIFVNGIEVTPHFRFITTFRNMVKK